MEKFTKDEKSTIEENVKRYARVAKAFEVIAHLLGVGAILLAIMAQWDWAVGAFVVGLVFWGLRRGALASGERYIDTVEAEELHRHDRRPPW